MLQLNQYSYRSIEMQLKYSQAKRLTIEKNVTYFANEMSF